MEPNRFPQALEKARSITEIYELIKQACQQILQRSRSGIMLGLSDLGEGADAWIGGYHIISSNAIILNSRPIEYIKTHHPDIYNAYIFMVLLHEYIHSLGIIDEAECQAQTLHVSQISFGDHPVTRMAKDIKQYLPFFRQIHYGWVPSTDRSVYYLLDFDRSSVSYVI